MDLQNKLDQLTQQRIKTENDICNIEFDIDDLEDQLRSLKMCHDDLEGSLGEIEYEIEQVKFELEQRLIQEFNGRAFDSNDIDQIPMAL